MRLISIVLLALALLGCSSAASDVDSDAARIGTTTTATGEPSIAVQVQFPDVTGILVGPATVRVLDDDGVQVAVFEFGSGWVLPERWEDGRTAVRSGAPTMVDIELPTAARYTFVLEEFAVSNNPCGTCEQGFAGGSTQVDATDGTRVVLPAGDETWVS